MANVLGDVKNAVEPSAASQPAHEDIRFNCGQLCPMVLWVVDTKDARNSTIRGHKKGNDAKNPWREKTPRRILAYVDTAEHSQDPSSSRSVGRQDLEDLSLYAKMAMGWPHYPKSRRIVDEARHGLAGLGLAKDSWKSGRETKKTINKEMDEIWRSNKAILRPSRRPAMDGAGAR